MKHQDRSRSHYVKSTTRRSIPAMALIQLLQVRDFIFVAKTRAEKLGNHLRQTRQERGLSTRGLATKTGISHSTINRIEHGRLVKPRRDKLTKIANALELKLIDLYAHAGYLLPDELPRIDTYLAVKYRHVPAIARQELTALAAGLDRKHRPGLDAARIAPEGAN